MPSSLVVLVISLLLGLQPVTTDLYLPALPDLSRDLSSSMSQTQLTLTALLLSFGVSQMAWGPLSDRYGRRPILLWGMGSYVLAALASALAPTIEILLIARMVQGAALGAAVMGARAIVRDLYSVTDGTRVMSKGLTGLGILACLCAPVGGMLSETISWRAALLALAVFGAVTYGLLFFRLKESLVHPKLDALKVSGLWSSWRQILRHPTFWSCTILSATTFGGLFTFLATSSFVFIQTLGLSRTEYGMVMFTMPLSYILGTVVCRMLLPRFGLRRSVAFAGAISLAGGTMLGVSAMVDLHEGWAIMVPVYLFMIAHGVHQPCSQMGSIAPFPQAAGTATALNGFFMMLVAFAMGAWLGAQGQIEVKHLAYGIWFWGFLTALTAWTLMQRYGHIDQS